MPPDDHSQMPTEHHQKAVFGFIKSHIFGRKHDLLNIFDSFQILSLVLSIMIQIQYIAVSYQHFHFLHLQEEADTHILTPKYDIFTGPILQIYYFYYKENVR